MSSEEYNFKRAQRASRKEEQSTLMVALSSGMAECVKLRSASFLNEELQFKPYSEPDSIIPPSEIIRPPNEDPRYYKRPKTSDVKQHQSDPEKFIPVCDGCNKILTDKLFHCARCKRVYYCSRACQVWYWKGAPLGLSSRLRPHKYMCDIYVNFPENKTVQF